jgi:NAD(P)-dependent dehydrogenase (short-subunit alcohol dehydrogenase family)
MTARVAVVSGANRGLGLAIVERLAKDGYTVVLGSRSADRGESARATLADVADRVLVGVLDVSRTDNIAAFAGWLRRTVGRCDVLVNNAAVEIDGTQDALTADLDIVQETMQTNLYGAWQLTQAMVPAMRARRYGRIVNVSSGVGRHATMRIGVPAYRLSKLALNGLTGIVADELRGENILVNACCPGWVRTEMGGDRAQRSPADAADTPVWLATLPDSGPTGGFFRDRRPLEW